MRTVSTAPALGRRSVPLDQLAGMCIEGKAHTETDQRPTEPGANRRRRAESPGSGYREDLSLTLLRELPQ